MPPFQEDDYNEQWTFDKSALGEAITHNIPPILVGGI